MKRGAVGERLSTEQAGQIGGLRTRCVAHCAREIFSNVCLISEGDGTRNVRLVGIASWTYSVVKHSVQTTFCSSLLHLGMYLNERRSYYCPRRQLDAVLRSHLCRGRLTNLAPGARNEFGQALVPKPARGTVTSLPPSKAVVISSYRCEPRLRCPREPQAGAPAENSCNAHGYDGFSKYSWDPPHIPLRDRTVARQASSFKADPIKHEQTHYLKLDPQSFLLRARL